MVDPMSARLASAMTRILASAAAAMTSSKAAMPAAPCRSKKATCGLTTPTTPPKASMHRAPKADTPEASSGRPHRASSSAEGSMPAQKGPLARTASITRCPKGTAARAAPAPLIPPAAPAPSGPARRLSHVPLLSALARIPRRGPRTSPRSSSQHPDRGARVAEGGRPHLHGVSPGHEQLDGVAPAAHAPDPHDAGIRGWRIARRRRLARPPDGWPVPTVLPLPRPARDGAAPRR